METELGSIVKDSKDTCLVLEHQLQNLYQLLGSCDYDLEAKVHRLLDEVRAEYQLSISLRDQDSVQVYHQSSSDNSDSGGNTTGFEALISSNVCCQYSLIFICRSLISSSIFLVTASREVEDD